MTDNVVAHSSYDALPTFATVGEEGLTLDYRFGRLSLDMRLSGDEPPNCFFCISVFDETTSVATVEITDGEFYQYLLVAKRDGNDAAYARALDAYRTACAT